jgi:flagellar protein FliO/FliZ
VIVVGDTIAASFVKIIIFLPMVLILIYAVLKMGGSRVMKMGSGKIIRIIEKVPLSGKTFLCIAVINDKPYVISSTEERVEILMELPEESLHKAVQGTGTFRENMMTNLNTLLRRRDRQ